MNFDPISHIRELMQVEGISFNCFSGAMSDLAVFDHGLRSSLNPGDHYEDLGHRLQNSCQPRTLYILTDPYEARYIIFRRDLPEKPAELFIIGPYLFRRHERVLTALSEKSQDLPRSEPVLREFYGKVPYVLETSAFESEVVILVRHVFDAIHFAVIRADFDFFQNPDEFNWHPEENLERSPEMIEALYHHEDDVLEAIENGDVQTALMQMSAFRENNFRPRNLDLLRSYKNSLIVLNTLFRKAVARADVHPAHIDSTSSAFASLIESARSLREMQPIPPQMIRKYCLLVQNHSLRGYSRTVQRVINQVDFHLTEPLTLSALAELVSVNASYLSSQFKRETGQNLIDFINLKRIQKSLFLLNATELPIRIIAERVGISDENYFSRVFRKVQGRSPREYRKSVKDTGVVGDL